MSIDGLGWQTVGEVSKYILATRVWNCMLDHTLLKKSLVRGRQVQISRRGLTNLVSTKVTINIE